MSVTAQIIIDIMKGWIGADKRQIIDLYNSHKPLAQGYAVKYTDAWCDTTVSAAFIKANAVDLIGGTECGVERHIALFKKKGIWEEDGNITPKAGDIICYNWDDGTQPNDGFADHIGVVESVFGTNITVIEGNYNDQVARRTIPVGWGYIRGYAKPKYDTATVAPTPVANAKMGAVDISKPIIDISEWQGVIDWNSVKPQIGGAIIRVAYGTRKADNYVARNLSECDRLGIPYGVYIYSLANSDATAKAEADYAMQLVKGHKPSMPIYIDLEETQYRSTAKTVAKAFCNAVKSAGYKYGVYSYESYFNSYLDGIDMQGCSYWIAKYGTNNGQKQSKPNVNVAVDGWQYTSVGRFLGISGNVDTNEFYNDFSGEVKDTTIHYRAHCQKKGWMPAVKNGEWAGTKGEGLRLEAIKVTPPEGVELEITVHVQTYGDRIYKGITKGLSSGLGSSANDPIIGTVGESKRVEAITIKCTKNSTGKKLKYQGHVQSIGDTKICSDGELCGTTGKSKRLEALRIWFE